MTISLEETFALALQNHKKKNLRTAENLYNEILKKNPNYVGALNNLGILHNQFGNNQKAINCYEKAIQINPNHVDAHNNLGILHNQFGNNQKAINCYEKAIQINPNHVDAHNNLGILHNQLGNNQKAINCYEKAIQINPNHVDAHNNLANIFKKLGKNHEAISCYEKAIQINPNHVDAHNNLGILHNQLGNNQKAINCYDKVIKIDPANLTAHWLSMNNFPDVYKNLEEITHYRKRFEKSIKKLNKLIDVQSHFTKQKFINAISSSTNFYLHYQGKDILELQRNYASLIERITKKIYQKFHKKRKKITSTQCIKIGFVSSFFRKHTVSKLFKNWILKLDEKKFEKYVYYSGNKFDDITEKIKQKVDHFYNHTNVDQLINKIFRDNLDVIIYLDIGMSPIIQIISSLRLAPIQCNTWGHPITSGFKNIDYYLSGELMEDQNSQQHYSEKLITLPGLGINYDLPNLSKIKKTNILKKSKTTIFLNLQSLFKLLPQDDHIYLDIIKENQNCYFWFLQGKKKIATSIFKDRVSKLFQKEGYSFEKFSYFHPKCSQEEFFGVIKQSDIILDSFNWSGGNTSLEAISLDKPIVTFPSRFMRGRHTYGILKTLEIEETIASSKKNYVEIALKLASDISFRDSIVDKIKKHKKKLFNNDKPIKFLEDIIQKKLTTHF